MFKLLLEQQISQLFTNTCNAAGFTHQLLAAVGLDRN